jgi:hypothetical protein
MNRRLSIITRAFLAAFAFAVVTAGTASARGGDRGDDGEFRWLAATGLVVFGQLCDLGTPCPDAALESGKKPDLVEIMGEGTLEIDGRHRDITGGGSYRILKYPHVTPDDVLDFGSWTATKLKSFESFGPVADLPMQWEEGVARMQILMVSDRDGEVMKGTLELGCRLDMLPPDPIEGIRLKVKKGQNFNMEPPLVDGTTDRATLFIRLPDDGRRRRR